MALADKMEDLLDEIKDTLDIEEITLISRSGMHIGGDVPEDAHLETYVAMSAILLGSAETATSELEEELSHVIVDLKKSRILVKNCGPSALMAVKLSQEADVEEVIEGIEEPTERLQDLL